MKIGEVKIEELFATTDWCLRNSFPDDYDARCLYSACAIQTILKSKRVKAIIVGGNVGAFTLSTDGREALLEGFGGGDITQPSHYWVEANGVILDPGVSYLPKRSRMSAVSMPMIAWTKNNALPKYIQYIEKVRYAEEAEYIFPSDIANRVAEFIARCEKRYTSRTAKKKLSTWLLTNQKDLDKAARSGDRWATGAIRFQSMGSVPTIPV
ncbi:hypothetical protein [Halomonas dongshanensis]|uniref:Uncharacterized protein n=1 Tax=Halomonas dongshanensis TaxID=2890835 RepID=A0ABT2EIG6_9GAMM|nr:hypothetical protein [Halomonas dongshanensis]MCS2611148.1 hypothetical protein [Halomonas dongshanensis]